ncbi:MAG: hypothetical protein KKE44_23745, partial [Proteobacteria bacterium]|nr:hypothetical protein [Pseudomonadota bacterium]
METRREQLRIDPKKCTACHRCTIACSMKHHGTVNPHLSRIKILQFKNQELNVPVICMACENAPCIKVCPMNASRRTPCRQATGWSRVQTRNAPAAPCWVAASPNAPYTLRLE